jgi:hypothetical protein
MGSPFVKVDADGAFMCPSADSIARPPLAQGNKAHLTFQMLAAPRPVTDSLTVHTRMFQPASDSRDEDDLAEDRLDRKTACVVGAANWRGGAQASTGSRWHQRTLPRHRPSRPRIKPSKM